MQAKKGHGRGFASMTVEKKREIASKGGRAAHALGTAHKWTSEEAQAAGRRAAPLVVADLRTPCKAVGKAYLEKGWFYRPALFDSGKLHVELGINPYIVQEHHKMDVGACRGSCAALVANYLSPGHILTDLHNVMIHMPVNSGNVVAVINFDRPAKPRPVPTDPDHLTRIGCYDGRSVGCR